jgi:hypothetical protein
MTVRQCETCQHWQRRGGIVTTAAMQCVTLEGERLGDRSAAIITRMARLLAARNQCPAYSPFTNYPDAYRAQDLPLETSP